MSDLSWKTSSFELHSSSRPLRYAVLSIFFALIIFFLVAAFYKVEKTVVAQGEVSAFDGEKSVVAARDGNLIEVSAHVGDKVVRGQVLARIQIPFTEEKLVKQVMTQIQVQHHLLLDYKYNIGDLNFPNWVEIKSENPTLTKLISEAESTWQKYKLADRSLKLLAKKQLQNGEIQKKKLLVKINSLKKSSQKALLTSLIDELEEKLQKLESDQIAIKEDARAKITVARTDALNSLKYLALQINEFIESYQIKTYSDGMVARSLINNFQQVTNGQPAFSIIPSEGRFNAVLKVPSMEVGSVEINQPVSIEVDSFPHRRYGYFTGRVESIDQSSSFDESRKRTYVVRVSLIPPKQNDRDIASTMRILPGMKIEAFIETRSLPLLRIMYEKIFTNDTE